ncbi:MAG TPA: thiamine pyrophosphate-requiring protein [Xanthobacteraceae bacterium]|nr:thiamine pyrophosphate-requiring protein [Xanthobacteraceae bacterium]
MNAAHDGDCAPHVKAVSPRYVSPLYFPTFQFPSPRHPKDTHMNGADVVAEILRREGTDFLSAYPRNPLIESCAALNIRPIFCRQERVGVGLADGYSRIKRGKKNGVFAAQAGPGIENAFPGVAQAYTENVPMLMIPAGLPLSKRSIKPTFCASDVYRPVTKWSALAYSVQELPDLMRRAYQAMRSGKGGPVMVEIPNEIFEAEFKGEIDYTPVPMQRTAPDPDAIKEAARMLLAAKNPVLWAGQGIHYAEAGDLLATLAELIPAPVVATNPGKSAIPDSHPLALGSSTRSRSKMFTDFMTKADVVMAIGSSLTKTNFGPNMPPSKTLIHSTNEASDINKESRATLSVIGDAALVIEALITEVEKQKGAARGSIGLGGNALASLKEEIATGKKAWLAEWAKHLDSDETPLNQYRVIRDMMRTMDRDNVIMTHDSGSPREQLLPFWETTKAGSYMGWGKSTQLGYGLGITIGAKIAEPKKLCVNLMGDASFGMTGMDIETASRNKIAILTIVFNNGVMGAERDVLPISDEKYGTMTVGGNYTKVAEGLNVPAMRVDKPANIVGAIKEAVTMTEKGSPFLLEFVVKEGHDFSRYNLAGL